MVQTYDVDGTCPICGQQMYVTRLSCGHCGSALEGVFTLRERPDEAANSASRSGPLGSRRTERTALEARFGRLARLDGEQLEFVEVFLRCRGVIKNVEDMLGISYPTVRARLANVLDAMGFGTDDDAPAPESRRLRRDILADLAAGRISTEEAHRLLARAAGGEDEGDL